MATQIPIDFGPSEPRRLMGAEHRVTLLFDVPGDLLASALMVNSVSEWLQANNCTVWSADTVLLVAPDEATRKVSLAPQGEIVWLNPRFAGGIHQGLVVVWGSPVGEAKFNIVKDILLTRKSPVVAVIKQADGLYRFKRAMLESDWKSRNGGGRPKEDNPAV